MLFSCYFFPERLLNDMRTFRLRSVWGYLRGGFGTLYTPGVEYFGGVMNAPLWSNNSVKSILFVLFGIYIADLLLTLALYNSNACKV